MRFQGCSNVYLCSFCRPTQRTFVGGEGRRPPASSQKFSTSSPRPPESARISRWSEETRSGDGPDARPPGNAAEAGLASARRSAGGRSLVCLFRTQFLPLFFFSPGGNKQTNKQTRLIQSRRFSGFSAAEQPRAVAAFIKGHFPPRPRFEACFYLSFPPPPPPPPPPFELAPWSWSHCLVVQIRRRRQEAASWKCDANKPRLTFVLSAHGSPGETRGGNWHRRGGEKL